MDAGKVIAGASAAIIAAEGVFAVRAGASSELLRPPGIQGEADFMARCVKCGRCIEACPYAVIHVAGPLEGAATGTPCIDARERACRLCLDFPCVAACPTGALRDVASRRDPRMGYALIDEETCIAYKGYRCEVCYRVCPLIDEAISIDFRTLEGDAIHTRFIPVVDEEACTGCGLCVERCAVGEPHVPVRVVSLAEQEKRAGKGERER